MNNRIYKHFTRFIGQWATSVLLAATFTNTASAGGITLDQVIGHPAYSVFADDSSKQSARLIDTDGTNDDSNIMLLMETSSFSFQNTFGIYGFHQNSTGQIVVDEELEVFAGAVQPGFGMFPAMTTLSFNLVLGTVTNQMTGASANIGESFGFYLDTPSNNGTRLYSHDSLNQGAADAVLMFDTSSMSYMVGGADLILAWDVNDGFGNGQYNDMVISLNDVVPVPAPNAITFMVLFTLLGVIAKQKKSNRVHRAS